jgi:LEA14-like dessication related protein
MKYIKPILALTGLSIIGYALYNYVVVQKNLLTQFTYRILNIKFTKISMTNISANLLIRFNNAADFEVKVKNFYVDFYVNGIYVGHFEDAGQFVISAHGSTDVPMFIQFDPSIIFTNIIDLVLISGDMNDVAIGVHGFASVATSIIQVTIPVDYDSSVKEILSD